MDIFLPIVLVIVFFILFSICGWCCKRKHQGTVFGQSGAPITISNQPVNASPVVIPPYPLDPHHPVPQPSAMHAPAPGFAPIAGYQGGYPPMPAPGFYCPPGVGFVQSGGSYPGVYPPAAGGGGMYPPQSAGAPYPPQTAPPPSYHEAVMQPPPPPAQVANEGYVKQAPYNPNY